MTEPTDLELIERARAGDADALGTLVDGRSATLFRFADRLLDSGADAEAVVRETFLAAILDVKKAPVRLDSICEDFALAWDRERRWRSKPSDPVGIRNTFAGAATEALGARTLAAVERLPLDLRRPLLHRYLLGLDEAESMTRLGISARTLRLRLRSALARVAHEVPEYEDDLPSRLAAVLAAEEVPSGLADEIPNAILARRQGPGLALGVATAIGAIVIFVAAIKAFLPG